MQVHRVFITMSLTLPPAPAPFPTPATFPMRKRTSPSLSLRAFSMFPVAWSSTPRRFADSLNSMLNCRYLARRLRASVRACVSERVSGRVGQSSRARHATASYHYHLAFPSSVKSMSRFLFTDGSAWSVFSGGVKVTGREVAFPAGVQALGAQMVKPRNTATETKDGRPIP